MKMQFIANSVRLEIPTRGTINQYIHPNILQTCQVAMGLTELEDGSVWNTIACSYASTPVGSLHVFQFKRMLL
jgi:5-keto 4-deoxyuronate isomerase